MDEFLKHPVWFAAFRPFFLLAAALAFCYALLWALLWVNGVSIPGQISETPILFHAHGMLSGMVLASGIGFLLTALPEFTATPFPRRSVGMIAFAVFVSGQMAFFLPVETAGWTLSFVTHATLLIYLFIFAVRRLQESTARKHRGFAWALLALLFTVVGFYYDVLSGNASLRFVRASVGVWMILIILSLSRVSMRIVNHNLEQLKSEERYLARPPRRNIAIICIILFTGFELFQFSNESQGFVALACAGAVFHLMSDWHLGRVLFRRYVWPLYAVYWCMALGYGLIGYSLLSGELPSSAGRHLLMIGAMGISIYMVMSIAGRIHSGIPLSQSLLIPFSAALILAAAAMRFFYALQSDRWIFLISILFWSVPFILYFVTMWPILFGPRPDQHKDASPSPTLDP